MLIKTAQSLENWGGNLATAVHRGQVLFLTGELGAGKTTVVRGLLRALGHTGPVKSPTYTLVESYYLPEITVHHFDLYRLSDGVELEEMGFRDYVSADALVCIEWPEKAADYLTTADIRLRIDYHPQGREVRLEK